VTSGPVTLINLNRPSRKNAFGREMISQLEESIREVNNSNTRVIILRSLVNGCFSAGADLKERATMLPDEVPIFVDKLRSTFGMLEELAVPTLAAIDGVALGGGLELALCCDLRYAGPDVKIGLPETRLAILPAAGGSQRLSRLIGASRAKELVFTAATLDSQEALKYGIINDVASSTAFERAMQVALKICENGPLAIRYAKEAINKGLCTDLYELCVSFLLTIFG
jgi:methylglutaconyl-CoA hydratase